MRANLDELADVLIGHMHSDVGDIGVRKADIVDYFSGLNNNKLLEFAGMIVNESSLCIEKMYDALAADYDRTFAKRDHIQEAINLIDDGFFCDTGVDLGCGTGRSTEPLLQFCQRVIGIDISNGMLAEARKRLDDPRVTFMQGGFNDAGIYPFAADLVFCVGVTRYIPLGREVEFMQYLDRLMNVGGVAILTFVVRAENSIEAKIDILVESLLNKRGLSDRRFTLAQIQQMADFGGFSLEKIVDMPSPFLYTKKIVRMRKNA